MLHAGVVAQDLFAELFQLCCRGVLETCLFQPELATNGGGVEKHRLIFWCWQTPFGVEFYWFRAAVKFYNTMLQNTNPFLKGVLCADVHLSATAGRCWSAQFMSGFVGLSRGTSYAQAVQNVQAVEFKDFIPDLCARHVGVLRDVAQLDPCTDNRKLACYKNWMALPLRCRSMSSKMLPLPKYLCLNLSRNIKRN